MLTRAQKRKSEGDKPDNTKRLSVVLHDIYVDQLVLPSPSQSNVQSDADDGIQQQQQQENAVDSNESNNGSAQNVIGDSGNQQQPQDDVNLNSIQMNDESKRNDADSIDGLSDELNKDDEIEQNVELLRNTIVNYRLVPVRKNQFVLYSIDEKQKYKKNRYDKTNGCYGYTCCVDKCTARVFRFDNGECKFSKNFEGHNHAKTFECEVAIKEFEDDCCKESAKMESINGQLMPLKDIFTAKAEEANVKISYKSIERKLRKARREALPKSPTNAAQINEIYENEFVRETYGMTLRAKPKDGEENKSSKFFKYAYECSDFSYCVYASDDIINAILSCSDATERSLYADATFGICPLGIFKQILILFGEVNGHVVPFAYILMSNKTQKAYEAVFQYINDNVMALDCSLFMADYEKALRNGFASVVPSAKIVGCWFHFSQACKRYAMKLSKLMKLVRTNKDAERIYYKLLCLPLLPADKIVSAFETIKKKALELSQLFKKFLTYYEKQWLIREGPEAISVFGVINRTTGALEAYNGVLGRSIPTRSHFFRFVFALIHFERKKAYDVSMLVESGGGTGPDKKYRSKVRNAKIIDACNDYKEGKIKVNAFLDRVTFYETKICANLLAFEKLSTVDADDDDLSLFVEEEEGEEVNEMLDEIVKDQNNNARSLCGSCVANERDCVLVPCGHVYFCMACFLKWKSTDTAVFDLMLEDGEEVPSPEFDDLQPTLCPYCKSEVKSGVQIRPT